VVNAVYDVAPAHLPRTYDRFVEGFATFGGSGPRIFWFLWTGLAWIALGALCHWVERSAKLPIPRFVGLATLAYAACGFVLVPVSGFSILVAVSIVMLNRRVPSAPN
jgi:hypothetical protein